MESDMCFFFAFLTGALFCNYGNAQPTKMRNERKLRACNAQRPLAGHGKWMIAQSQPEPQAARTPKSLLLASPSLRPSPAADAASPAMDHGMSGAITAASVAEGAHARGASSRRLAAAAASTR